MTTIINPAELLDVLGTPLGTRSWQEITAHRSAVECEGRSPSRQLAHRGAATEATLNLVVEIEDPPRPACAATVVFVANDLTALTRPPEPTHSRQVRRSRTSAGERAGS